MPVLSNLSDYEDEDDIIAEYETRDSDVNQLNVERDEGTGSENEESTEANNVRRIDPSTSKKHVVRNPIPKLNTERVKGPKGIQTIEKYFEGFKFHGKGYEKLDLDRVMKRMEHWAHRLFPKLEFDDFIEKLEKLGTKKDLQVFIKKYRLDMITADDAIIVQDNVDEENDKAQDEPFDEFDLLIAEQIEKQKQVINQQSSTSNAAEALFDKVVSETNNENSQPVQKNPLPPQLSDETKERIERNKQQAIQRRLARLKTKEMEEESKKQKLEEVKGTQSEDSACNLQTSSETANSENKNFKNNSQEADKDDQTEIPQSQL
ncbi:TIMELESS-interacting protein [Colletes latitarsis]|uniref:TIMELESS-interacting protein n=1 Tax=Colletes latitarsis TaxID=2605962 RepID=UPI004034FD7A